MKHVIEEIRREEDVNLLENREEKAPVNKKQLGDVELLNAMEDLPTSNNLKDLQKYWFEQHADIMTGAPPHLRPVQAISHAIPLIDKSKHHLDGWSSILTSG